MDAVLMIWIEDKERVARDRMIDAIMLKYKKIAVEWDTQYRYWMIV